VVKYERSFEDSVNVYIILELCPNQTLNELIKRRKRITEL
jgi:polo-like kinase 1